jgi:type III pantothenate kinase
MLLAIDIGNTNIAAGVFEENKLLRNWKIQSERGKTCDEYAVTLSSLFSLSGLDTKEIAGIIISSVVPPLTPVFQELSRDQFSLKPLVLGPGLKTGMPILYENPLEVGADRVASAVAGYTKHGGPLVIVDFGTATTFDAVSGRGEYLGGAIAPGIQIAAEALSLKTAKLPRVEIKMPKMAIGRSTVASMHSGLYFGYIGLVSHIITKIKAELETESRVVATGGLAALFSQKIDTIDFNEPHLVLEGLRILFERNRADNL